MRLGVYFDGYMKFQKGASVPIYVASTGPQMLAAGG